MLAEHSPRRQALAAGLRDLAAYIETEPDMIVPDTIDISHEVQMPEPQRLAGHAVALDASYTEYPGHAVSQRHLGPVFYKVTTWGRP